MQIYSTSECLFTYGHKETNRSIRALSWFSVRDERIFSFTTFLGAITRALSYCTSSRTEQNTYSFPPSVDLIQWLHSDHDKLGCDGHEDDLLPRLPTPSLFPLGVEHDWMVADFRSPESKSSCPLRSKCGHLSKVELTSSTKVPNGLPNQEVSVMFCPW